MQNHKTSSTFLVNGVDILNCQDENLLHGTSPHLKESNSPHNNNEMTKSKRRFNHNQVERRRRDQINKMIIELETMVPKHYFMGVNNKGIVLKNAVKYITELKEEMDLLKKENENLKRCPLVCNSYQFNSGPKIYMDSATNSEASSICDMKTFSHANEGCLENTNNCTACLKNNNEKSQYTLVLNKGNKNVTTGHDILGFVDKK